MLSLLATIDKKRSMSLQPRSPKRKMAGCPSNHRILVAGSDILLWWLISRCARLEFKRVTLGKWYGLLRTHLVSGLFWPRIETRVIAVLPETNPLRGTIGAKKKALSLLMLRSTIAKNRRKKGAKKCTGLRYPLTTSSSSTGGERILPPKI